MTNSITETVVTNPIWWKRRSALERGLMILAAFGGLLCFALGIAICVLSGSSFRPCNTTSAADPGSTSNSSQKNENVCFSADCVHTASMVLKNMDPDVDPCDNFYKFACGGFIKSSIIPDNKIGADNFIATSDKLRQQLRKSMESKIEDKEQKPFRLVKNLYNSCMNTTEIEAKGLKSLEALLKKLDGWPVVVGDKWNESNFDWISSMYKSHDAGLMDDVFLELDVSSDLMNNSKNVLYLDQGSLGMPLAYLLKGFDHKAVQAYYSYMVEIAVILGADRERATTELKESLSFEIKLADIIVPMDEIRRNITKIHNPIRVSELKKKYPSIPWQEYFRRLLPSSISIDENEIVIVVVPRYIEKLEKLMSITPKKVQANLIIWRIIKSLVRYLNDDLRKIQLAYSKVLIGATERESRWKECVNMVSGNLPISVGAMYVRKYFKKGAKINAEEMVTDIKKEFNIILKEIEWMDNKTRQNALEKAADMSSNIAYPDELLDDKKLDEFYAKLEFSGGDYLGSVLNLSIFDNEYELSKLREPVNKTSWMSNGRPAVVNAFYSPAQNSIKIPAGILQGVFFNNNHPRYMNYGAIGLVIGHEITHGFDTLGRQFDKNGNLVDWWAPTTKKTYLKRAECIIHQYENYTIEEIGKNVNGFATQNENIADNGGFKVAYLAYKKWANKNLPEAQLPGLSYTPRQMFWISAANVWCSNIRPEILKLRTNTDSHSPGEFRIVGPLSNSPEFSKDFNCPIHSKMNPDNKCSVW